MTTAQAQKLDRLKYYGTRYEVVAIAPDGEQFLMLYTARKSRRGMIGAVHEVGRRYVNHGDAPHPVVRLLGTDEVRFPGKAASGMVAGEWRIVWGRTQRDAICNGELPFLGDANVMAEALTRRHP